MSSKPTPSLNTSSFNADTNQPSKPDKPASKKMARKHRKKTPKKEEVSEISQQAVLNPPRKEDESTEKDLSDRITALSIGPNNKPLPASSEPITDFLQPQKEFDTEQKAGDDNEAQNEPEIPKNGGHKKLNQAQRRKLASELTINLDFRSSLPEVKPKRRPKKTPYQKYDPSSGPAQSLYQPKAIKAENIPPVVSEKVVPTFKEPIQGKGVWVDRQRTRPHINISTSCTTCSEPLKEFTIFPDLPLELRLKIWRFSFHQERLIELEWDIDPTVDAVFGDEPEPFEIHQRVRVSTLSRKPPAVLHTCRDAREEGLKFYQLTKFDTHTFHKPMSNFSIYYKPNADIIYFGDATCISTMIQVFRQKKRIPRVAVVCTGRIGKLNQCCDWDQDGSPYSEEWGGSIPGGCSPIQALHGVDPQFATNTGFPGCIGLKDVFFIIPTHYQTVGAHKVNSKTTFRQAITNGITQGQRLAKKKLVKDLKQVDNSGLINVGRNKWAGENKPMFRFRTLTTRGEGKRYHDAMLLNFHHGRKLGISPTDPGVFVDNLEQASGCKITVCNTAAPGEKDREVGFYGTEKEISEAKKGFEDKIETFENLNREYNQYQPRGG